MTDEPALQLYEGTGETLEEAVDEATRQILPRPHRDFAVSRVVEWGMQFGGITGARLFYAKVIEDPTASFKT